MVVLGILAELHAGLENLLGGQRGGGLRDGSGIVDGVGDGGLEVHVLASLHGGEGQILVLVRGRGNDHRLDVRVGQELFSGGVSFSLRSGVGGALQSRLVMVTNGDHGCIGQLAEVRDNVAPLRSQADDTEFHGRAHRLLLVARVGLRRRQCLVAGGLGGLVGGDRHGPHQRQHAGHGSPLEEGAAIEIRSVRVVLHRRVAETLKGAPWEANGSELPKSYCLIAGLSGSERAFAPGFGLLGWR